MTDQATVSLLRWLRRQLRSRRRSASGSRPRSRTTTRPRPAADRVVEFTDAQRRRVEGLIDQWEASRRTAANEAVVRRIFDAFARNDGFPLRDLFAPDV